MKTINLGEPLEPITIPPVDLERNPWSASGDPRKIDAKKIKDLEVETITMSDDGYFRSGKLAFNDTSNAGWYQSSKGIYMGTAGDTKSLKYDVLAGTIVFKGVDLSWSDITGAGKPANNATVGAKAGTNLVDSSGNQLSDTAIKNKAIADGTYTGGTFISGTTIYSPSISAGTITGSTIKTSGGSYPSAQMDSDGIMITGTSSLSFQTSGGLSSGWIGGGTYQKLTITNIYNDIIINAQANSVIFQSSVSAQGMSASSLGVTADIGVGGSITPNITGSSNLGSSSKLFSNVHAYNLSLDGGNWINYTGGFIQSNSQFRVVGSINLTGNLTFENNASITINGRAYLPTAGAFDPSKYYLRS